MDFSGRSASGRGIFQDPLEKAEVDLKYDAPMSRSLKF
jgi:hypothetical protein